MTEKDLKRLSRAELLELLLEASEQVETLQGRVEELQKALDTKTIQFQEAGNLAQAVLTVNRVYETVQAAAEQYLWNIREKERLLDEKLKALEVQPDNGQ